MATAAEESCPQGPYETDRDKIAAALTSLPTLPKTFARERQSHTKPETWTLTDGVASEGGGGLAPLLLKPNVPSPKQEPAKAKEPRANRVENVVIASPRPCENEYTDGHWESLVLRVGGTLATASPALSCSDALRLEALLSSAVGAPFLPW